MMKHLLTALLLGTAFVATSAHADRADHGTAAEQVQAGDLMISGAFARATLPRAPVGGAYFTVMNHGARDDRLLSVTAPVGKDVQIHTMEVKDGVMTMRPLPDGLPVPAGGTVTLEPSGTHLMLMGLTEKLVEGESLDLVLHFELAGDVGVTFPILALNARGPAGGGASGPETAAPDHSGHGLSHEAASFDQASVPGDEARITGLLKDMFETPETPLTVAPVLIDGDLAVIGWSQAETGGRALLRRDTHGFWRVSLCAGDGLKGETNMIALGIAPEAAARLAVAQETAEAALPPGQVARFALFEGVLTVEDAEH